MSRTRRILGEGARFFTVGGLATITALIFFNATVHGFNLPYDPPLADRAVLGFVLSQIVGMVVSYHGSRQWAFRDREPTTPDGGIIAFVAINIATMAIPVACLIFSRDVLGFDGAVADNISANLIGLTLGFLARFYLFRRFVFRHPEGPLPQPATVRTLDEILASHRAEREAAERAEAQGRSPQSDQ